MHSCVQKPKIGLQSLHHALWLICVTSPKLLELAGVDEIPALLKSRNVIIAKMTKEALQDILAKALSGVELPMELAQMPEAEIIDGMWIASQSYEQIGDAQYMLMIIAWQGLLNAHVQPMLL